MGMYMGLGYWSRTYSYSHFTVCYSDKTTTKNLVVQAIHGTSFQEEDTALSNETKPQFIICHPFTSSHSMVSQLSYWHLRMDMTMLWKSYWQQEPILTIKIK